VGSGGGGGRDERANFADTGNDDDGDEDDDPTPPRVTSRTVACALRILRETVVLRLLGLLDQTGPDALSDFVLAYPFAFRFFVWAVADAARPIERAELRQGMVGIGGVGGAISYHVSSPSLGLTSPLNVTEHTDAAYTQDLIAEVIIASSSGRAPSGLTDRTEDETVLRSMYVTAKVQCVVRRCVVRCLMLMVCVAWVVCVARWCVVEC
jgi:hypothetical protein